MSDRGFIVIDRKITDWKWWGNATARSIWLYLLVTANWKSGFNSDGTEIKRGQVCRSLRNIADDNQVTVKTIRYWLKKFENGGEIVISRAHYYQVINIVNYDKYQDLQGTKGTSTTTSGITSTTTDRTKITIVTKKPSNQVTNKDKRSCSSDDERSLPDANEIAKKSVLSKQQTLWFNEFWTAYPRKTGKAQAEKAFNKVCKNEVDFAAIMHGLSEQNRLKFQPMIDDGQEQYIPYPSTWLNGRRWEDKVTPYKEQKGEKSFFDFV